MSAPYHLIEEKAEDALLYVINANKSTNLNGVQILKGFEVTDEALPQLRIEAYQSEPADPDCAIDTANWLVAVRCIVKSHYSTTRTTHSAYVGRVRDIIFLDDMVAELNGASITDFHCDDFIIGRCTRDVDQECFVTTQEVVMRCFNLTVT